MKNRWTLPSSLIALLLSGCSSQLASGPQSAVVPQLSSAEEHEVAFRADDGLQLEGSLLVPRGEPGTRWPAVLLLPGSGPTDRDGNQPGFRTDLIKQLAQGLAEAGVATFRFDKRAVARYAGQWPKEPEKLGPFFSLRQHVADVRAAWRAMCGERAVDTTRCALLGHSEGGVLALELADIERPKALVLIGTPARDFFTVVREQLARQLAAAGDRSLKERLLRENDRVASKVVATGKVPADVPVELKGLYNPSVGTYLRELAGVRPGNLLAAYPGPVLILNGEKDNQVSPSKDAYALAAAAKRRGDRQVEIHVLPLASHNLKPVEEDSDPGLSGDVVPDAIELIVHFLAPVIGAKESVR